MSLDPDGEVDTDSEVPGVLENVEEVLENLAKELKELYAFRDLFFEHHPIEMAVDKNRLVDEKKELLVVKFEAIEEPQIPFDHRAQFLYLKGRCYNISTKYDARAAQCLSKAIKLKPHMVDAWNELGECYWKNLNVKEAKASFEGALKHQRNPLSLRCLSIILRQESGDKKRSEANAAVLKSVELAKEAVALDLSDGSSWTVLGNAYLCQFFMVAQDPAILKLCMSAYKRAWADPIAKGQPDLYYNKGIALKYEEIYHEALENFAYGCRLDPPWEPPRYELARLAHTLRAAHHLVRTRGKVKLKRLRTMLQSIDKKMLGEYGPAHFHTFGNRRDVTLEHVTLAELRVGTNEGKVALGVVVGSIHSENTVPFTFAIVDTSMECVCVNVYNWADGRGAVIGEIVALPEPTLAHHNHRSIHTPDPTTYDFKSIRVNNPTTMLVNGKRVGRNQFACTAVTSSYEVH